MRSVGRMLTPWVTAGVTWHSHDNYLPFCVIESVCHDAGPDKQEEMSEEEDAVECEQHLLINGDLCVQITLLITWVVVPRHRGGRIEHGGNDNADGGQQPDDEVVGDQGTWVHPLAPAGEDDFEVLRHDYKNRKAGLSSLVLWSWDFRD